MIIYSNYIYMDFLPFQQRRREDSMTTQKHTITANYNGDALKPGQVLIPVEYNELFVNTNCTNKDSIKTIYTGGRSFKVMYMAVDSKWEKVAKAQFNSIQHEQLGHYSISNSISLDALEKEYELILSNSPAADTNILEKEYSTEIKKRVRAKIESLIQISPKHGYALILMGLGVKSNEFAQKLYLQPSAAYRIRQQVQNLAKDHIYDFNELCLTNCSFYSSSKNQYYIEEAYKALELLLDMYFEQ